MSKCVSSETSGQDTEMALEELQSELRKLLNKVKALAMDIEERKEDDPDEIDLQYIQRDQDRLTRLEQDLAELEQEELTLLRDRPGQKPVRLVILDEDIQRWGEGLDSYRNDVDNGDSSARVWVNRFAAGMDRLGLQRQQLLEELAKAGLHLE